jgi:hypothetical protein
MKGTALRKYPRIEEVRMAGNAEQKRVADIIPNRDVD